MRFLLFFCGASIIALGIATARNAEMSQEAAFGFLQGALTLGGGLIISGGFASRWYWHGLIAGGVISLLGFARGLFNLGGLPSYFRDEAPNGPLPVLEASVTAICLFLLFGVVKTLLAERQRRLIEALENEEDADGKNP